MTAVMCDAITICRILGLRYLWIDSICIRQDEDRTDWEEQSQEMSHIFGNSWLTICAPASKSCSDGFLDHTDRHSPSIDIGYIPRDTSDVRGSFSLRVLTADGKPGFRDSHWVARMVPLQRDLQCSTWNNRGWVFQERSLSRRLLYFGARMIHFQHGDHVTSEDGSCFDDDFFDGLSFFGGTPHLYTDLLHQLERIQKQGPFITDFWYSMVPAISTSNFTDQRDILPAIAGVARRVHEFTGHQYLAGLWKEDLCCGLLWILDVRAPRPPYPASLRQTLQIIRKSATLIGPSWSWASRRSRSEFMITNKTNRTCRIRRHLRAEFDLLESHVLADGVNPYGRINEASITLLGSTINLSQDSVAAMRLKLCEVFPSLFVFVQPDWDPIITATKRRPTGISKQMRAHFHLLIVASCCSDCSRSSSCRAPQSATCQARGKPDLASKLSIVDLTFEEIQSIYLGSMRPHYRLSLYNDSHRGFDAMTHCDLCSDHSLRRDIWGLLLYPAGAPDEFYRVGTFFSRAQHGGSAIFEGTERRRIKLI